MNQIVSTQLQRLREEARITRNVTLMAVLYSAGTGGTMRVSSSAERCGVYGKKERNLMVTCDKRNGLAAARIVVE